MRKSTDLKSAIVCALAINIDTPSVDISGKQIYWNYKTICGAESAMSMVLKTICEIWKSEADKLNWPLKFEILQVYDPLNKSRTLSLSAYLKSQNTIEWIAAQLKDINNRLHFAVEVFCRVLTEYHGYSSKGEDPPIIVGKPSDQSGSVIACEITKVVQTVQALLMAEATKHSKRSALILRTESGTSLRIPAACQHDALRKPTARVSKPVIAEVYSVDYSNNTTKLKIDGKPGYVTALIKPDLQDPAVEAQGAHRNVKVVFEERVITLAGAEKIINIEVIALEVEGPPPADLGGSL